MGTVFTGGSGSSSSTLASTSTNLLLCLWRSCISDVQIYDLQIRLLSDVEIDVAQPVAYFWQWEVLGIQTLYLTAERAYYPPTLGVEKPTPNHRFNIDKDTDCHHVNEAHLRGHASTRVLHGLRAGNTFPHSHKPASRPPTWKRLICVFCYRQ